MILYRSIILHPSMIRGRTASQHQQMVASGHYSIIHLFLLLVFKLIFYAGETTLCKESQIEVITVKLEMLK